MAIANIINKHIKTSLINPSLDLRRVGFVSSAFYKDVFLLDEVAFTTKYPCADYRETRSSAISTSFANESAGFSDSYIVYNFLDAQMLVSELRPYGVHKSYA